MMIGKTWSSIEKSEIFSLYSEAEVLTSVLPFIDSLPCLISSPLRVDTHPSFSIYMTKEGHIRFIDFATGDKGSLLDLLCAYWKCSFKECLDKLTSLLIKGKELNIKPGNLKTFTRKEAGSSSSIQVVVRPWRDYDYVYWASYGIEKKWLKYAEIYPIAYKIVTKKKSPEDKAQKFIFPTDKYAYAYCERKEGNLQLKIYQPFNTKGYKWYSKMDKSVIGLWTKIPEFGDKVIICSSMKDALCVACQLHIPTLWIQGEAFSMSATAIKELKRRYKQIYISFDTDKAGKKDAVKLSKQTGFINIVPNLGVCKDFSDAFKHYGKEWFLKTITPLFKNEMQSTSHTNTKKTLKPPII